MVQLLNPIQDYTVFTDCETQTVDRQNQLTLHRSKKELKTVDPFIIRSVGGISADRRQRRKDRLDAICATVVAVGFGLATLSFGFFLLNVS